MNINWLEATWLVICGVGTLVTLHLLIDALRERVEYRRTKNDTARRRARNLVLDGNVRRDSLRLVVQLCLLSVVFPSLLRPGEPDLGFSDDVLFAHTVAVLAIMVAPIVLLISSLFDARDRRNLRILSLSLVITEVAANTAAVDANTVALDKEHP